MNKNGWGLRMELVFILLFLICLVVAAIGLNSVGLFGDNKDAPIQKEPEVFSYTTLESKLKNAAISYFEENSSEFTEDKIIIRASSLYYNGYMSKLTDEKNNTCSGYVEAINNGSNSYVYVPYIKCNDYKTTGYEGSNDW